MYRGIWCRGGPETREKGIILSMSFTTIFFDLDDTLYPSYNGLWKAIRDRINTFMVERLSISAEETPSLRRSYYETYGTALRGLQVHYQVDPDEYLAFVHDLPLSSFLQPDPRLNELIDRLPQRKWIFTNADSAHARRVLEALNLSSCFEGIVDVRATGFACKPQLKAYRRAMYIAGEENPGCCVLIDDAHRNLLPARRLGFCTVLVGSTAPNPAACHSISSVHDLLNVMPGLVRGKSN